MPRVCPAPRAGAYAAVSRTGPAAGLPPLHIRFCGRFGPCPRRYARAVPKARRNRFKQPALFDISYGIGCDECRKWISTPDAD